MPAVVAIEEQACVLLLRHHRGHRTDTLVRLRLEDERRELSRGHGLEHDHLPAVLDVHPAHLDACRRLEATEHRRDVAQRDVGDVLADEPAVGCDADQYLATLAVQERAERLAGALQLGGRALELERLGLALRDERLEGGDRGHGWSGSSTGRKSPMPKLLECPRRMGPTAGVLKRKRII